MENNSRFGKGESNTLSTLVMIIFLLTNNITARSQREIDICQHVVGHKADTRWYESLTVCTRNFPLVSDVLVVVSISEKKKSRCSYSRITHKRRVKISKLLNVRLHRLFPSESFKHLTVHPSVWSVWMSARLYVHLSFCLPVRLHVSIFLSNCLASESVSLSVC